MILKRLSITTALLALSSLAQAEISYNYVEANYQIYSELDVYQWELKGSYQLNEQFYAVMEDSNLTNARSGSVGAFLPQANGLHIYGQLGLGSNVGDMYPIVEAGVRAELNDDFEVRGAVRLEPELVVGAETGETMLLAEGLFHVNDKVDFVGGLVLPSELDGNVIRLGARVNFD